MDLPGTKSFFAGSRPVGPQPPPAGEHVPRQSIPTMGGMLSAKIFDTWFIGATLGRVYLPACEWRSRVSTKVDFPSLEPLAFKGIPRVPRRGRVRGSQVMDGAYEREERRPMVLAVGLDPVASPLEKPAQPLGRKPSVPSITPPARAPFFSWLTGFVRFLTRFEMPDLWLAACLHAALVVEAPIYIARKNSHRHKIMLPQSDVFDILGYQIGQP